MKTHEYNVAGVTYHIDAIKSIMEPNEDYKLKADDLYEKYGEERIFAKSCDDGAVKLVPEPDNEHDPNAIKVMIDGAHVGYIRKKDAEEVRKIIDSPSFLGVTVYKSQLGDYKQCYAEDDRILTEHGTFDTPSITLHLLEKEADDTKNAPAPTPVKEQRPKMPYNLMFFGGILILLMSLLLLLVGVAVAIPLTIFAILMIILGGRGRKKT